MKTSERLLNASKTIWDAYNEHPFVLGIQNGTLERDKFRYYIMQDFLYLKDYAKTNSREFFADCFVYWITYSADKKRMDDFRDAAPQTYAYMKKLATNNWGSLIHTVRHGASQKWQSPAVDRFSLFPL